MDNLARVRRRRELLQTIGVVERGEGAAWIIATDDGEVSARRAVSCLVEPQAGDEVALMLAGDGRAYVTAVLEREEGAPARMTVSGDLTLELPKGRLGLRAARGIGLSSGKDVRVTAGALELRALTAEVATHALTYVGSLLRADLQAVKTRAATFDSVLDRFTQRVKQSYRRVEELDRVKAGQISYSAEQNLYMSGENTVMNAEELVKVDAEQIQLG